MEIAVSARKHGVADRDILHAIAFPIREVRQCDVDRVLIIGAEAACRLLEVVVLDPDEDDPVVVHAMELRPKFRRFL